MPWRLIADEMWAGNTVQDACKTLNLDWQTVYQRLNVEPEIKSYLLDVSLLANAREEFLQDEILSENHGGYKE
jgi:hypothetical protein